MFGGNMNNMNNPPNNNNQQAQQPNPFMGMFNPYMYGGAMGQQQPQQPQQPQQNVQPAILYRDQLSQLNSVGFTDADANLQALVATGGNVPAAVDRLLGGN
eukprot:UN11863